MPKASGQQMRAVSGSLLSTEGSSVSCSKAKDCVVPPTESATASSAIGSSFPGQGRHRLATTCPFLHRYASQEFAYQLWLAHPEIAACACQECDGDPPIALEYHGLMKHSVHCRAREIAEWGNLPAPAMAKRLDRDFDLFMTVLDDPRVPSLLKAQGERQAAHLPRWAHALRLASEG